VKSQTMGISSATAPRLILDARTLMVNERYLRLQYVYPFLAKIISDTGTTAIGIFVPVLDPCKS
jgi:hypothetical protein